MDMQQSGFHPIVDLGITTSASAPYLRNAQPRIPATQLAGPSSLPGHHSYSQPFSDQGNGVHGIPGQFHTSSTFHSSAVVDQPLLGPRQYEQDLLAHLQTSQEQPRGPVPRGFPTQSQTLPASVSESHPGGSHSQMPRTTGIMQPGGVQQVHSLAPPGHPLPGHPLPDQRWPAVVSPSPGHHSLAHPTPVNWWSAFGHHRTHGSSFADLGQPHPSLPTRLSQESLISGQSYQSHPSLPAGQPHLPLSAIQPHPLFPAGQLHPSLPTGHPQLFLPAGHPQSFLPAGHPQSFLPAGQPHLPSPIGQPLPLLPTGRPLQSLRADQSLRPSTTSYQGQSSHPGTSHLGPPVSRESMTHFGYDRDQTPAEADPFIQNWLRKNRPSYSGKDTPKRVKLVEIRSHLVKGGQLLSALKLIQQQLQAEPDMDEVKCEQLVKHAQECKNKFMEIRTTLDQDGLKDHFSSKTNTLRTRRERQRQKWIERKRKWHKRVKILDDRTEEWVKEREQKQLKGKMEKDVQASVAEVLGAVKQKTSEVKDLLAMVEALKELREVRRETSRKKGDAPPIEADERFESTHMTLVDVLTRQVSVCEKEDHALRVLMEEEVKEKMQQKEKGEKPSMIVGVADDDAAEDAVLQPAGVSPTVLDPLEPYRAFYRQALHSKEALEAIRCSWDQYQNSEGSPLPAKPLHSPGNSYHNWSNSELQKDRLTCN